MYRGRYGFAKGINDSVLGNTHWGEGISQWL
jgi:hypothetical protein